MRLKDKKEIYKNAIGASLLSTLALSIKLNIPDTQSTTTPPALVNLLCSYDYDLLTEVLLFLGMTLAFIYTFSNYEVQELKRPYIRIPAVLFSLFMVFGYSFQETNSWNLVMTIKCGQPIKVAVAIIGYYIIFSSSILCIYSLLDKLSILLLITSDKRRKKSLKLLDTYYQSFRSHPFMTTFFSILILYIPYAFISYPAIFMGDSISQICQAFSELGRAMGYMKKEQLISDTIFINQHHPVAHTLLIHLFLIIGRSLFNSFNVGAFLYCLVQVIFVAGIVSYTSALIGSQTKRPEAICIITVAYVFLHPLIHNYMFVVTKDVFYTGFLILAIDHLFLLFTRNKEKLDLAILMIACLGMILFRNDAKFILLAAFLVAPILIKKYRKQFLTVFVFIAACSIVINSVFLHLGFTPGSNREMLSVPFQQTARYVHYHAEEVTPEEKDAIDKVLDYDALSKCYDPGFADPVKNTYKESSTKEDLLRYFKVWINMLTKHPGSYVQATMNNYYQYFYPGKTVFSRLGYQWSQENMVNINNAIQPLGQKFYYPSIFNKQRVLIDEASNYVSALPGLSLFMSPAIYSWLLILLFFFGIRSKNRRILVLTLIPIFVMLICLLGPCNGSYARYSYPVVVLMPFLIQMICILKNSENEKSFTVE